jgi:hypothetical protein
VKSYYASVSGYHDELLWAALWLHRATGRPAYLDYAVDNADEFGGTGWAITEFSWDVKYAGVQILAARVRRDNNKHLCINYLLFLRCDNNRFVTRCL